MATFTADMAFTASNLNQVNRDTATFSAKSASGYTLMDGTVKEVVTGVGLTYDASGFLTGGTVSSFKTYFNLGASYGGWVSYYSITNLAYNVTTAPASVTDDGKSYTGLVAEIAKMLAGNDTVTATVGASELYGFAGNDTIMGADGIDKIYGGSGNDLMDGGFHGDEMYGGSGNDIYIVGTALDKVVENPSQGTDTLKSKISITALVANVENLVLLSTQGDNFDSAVNGAGNGLNNVITGNGLNNNLNGMAGNDTLYGGGGNDTLNGSTGVDKLYGQAGNDVYYVDNLSDVISESISTTNTANAGGVDSVRSSVSWILGNYLENLQLLGSTDINGTGNALNNVIYANAGINRIDGKDGLDTVSFQYASTTGVDGVTLNLSAIDTSGYSTASGISGADKVIHVENITGTVYADTLTGNSSGNTLRGLAGDDRLEGMGGTDTLYGGAGNDYYVVENSGDIVCEETSLNNFTDAGGADQVNSKISYALTRYVEDLVLTGTTSINGTGNDLGNVIFGNSGQNTISGLGGDDYLCGGLGIDSLSGGSGKDTFKFDSVLTAANHKSITDFSSADDTIQLSMSVFPQQSTTGFLNSAYFKVVTSGQSGDSNDYIIYNNSTGALYYDADATGAGTAVQFATLTLNGVPASTLTYADIQIV